MKSFISLVMSVAIVLFAAEACLSLKEPAIAVSGTEFQLSSASGTIIVSYSLTDVLNDITLIATVEEDVDWLSAEVVDNTVVLNADTNTTGAERVANVTLSYYGADDVILTVTQLTSGIVVESQEVTMSSAAETYNVEYSVADAVEGETVSATMDDEANAEWLSFEVEWNEVSDSGRLWLTTTKNETGVNRVATVTLSYTGASDVTLTVTQLTSGIVVASTEITLSSVAGTTPVSYSVTDAVEGETLSAKVQEDVLWLSALVVDDETIELTADTNTTGAERVATVTLSYSGADDVVLNVTQSTSGIVVEKQEVTLSYLGGTESVKYSVTDAVEGETLSAYVEYGVFWLSAEVKVETNTIELTAGENTTGAERVATVTLSYSGADDVILTVTQLTTGIVVESTDITLPSVSKTISISYSVSDVVEGESLSAVPDLYWLTVEVKDNTIELTAETNTTGENRVATVTLSYVGANNVTLNVTQLTSEIVPESQEVTLSSAATTSSVRYSVTNSVEGETLTAGVSADWLSAVVGDTAITLTVDANEAGNNREATVTLSYPGAKDVELKVVQAASDIVVFTATYDGGWDGVSSVGVLIDGTVKEYTVTVNPSNNKSATLSSNDPHYWPESNNVSVTAWWPYTGETTLPNVVVNADQSTLSNFEGSNSISADQTVTYDNPALTFTRRTTRVTINLTDYINELESVKLTNLSTTNSNPSGIVPYKYDDLTYVAYVAPQTVAQGTAFVTCEFQHLDDYEYTMSYRTTWTAGGENSYTVSLAEAITKDYIYYDSNNTYIVYTANGLLAWNTAVQSNPATNCTLATNIDMTSVSWTLVCTSNRYTGTFDGGGYTVTGLAVSQTGVNYVGLIIGRLGTSGTVQNLTLENMSVVGSDQVGGLVGENYYGTVTNCSVSGSVTGAYNVGGVVGYNYGTVTNCTASVSISCTNNSIGGVVGSNSGTVSSCTVSGSVSTTGCYIGGVVGHNSGTVSDCTTSATVNTTYTNGDNVIGGVVGRNSGTVSSCTSSGNVTGSGEHVGGVVGINYVTVTYCSSSGNVTGYHAHVAGVVGYNSGGTVTACSSSSTVTGSGSNVGGVVGETNGGYMIACYHFSGTVTGGSVVGGVVGQTKSGGIVYACYHAESTVTGSGSNVAGVVGKNDGGTVNYCYWSGGNSTGSPHDSDGVTNVNGSPLTWSTAVSYMNIGISAWNSDYSDKQCNWRYVLSGDLPTLTPQ